MSDTKVTFADSSDDGSCTRLAGDGKEPICVSLDSPFVKKAGSNPAFDQRAYPEGRLQIDQLGTSNVAPLVVNGRLNPVLADRGIRVIVDTHGRTAHLSVADVEALSLYLKSLQK